MASELETKSASAENGEILDPIKETLERELERQLGAETKNLDPAVRKSLLSKSATLAIQFSGPIPPGFILKDYEDILPGAADRIIAMAERDQKHIHEVQRRERDQPHQYAMLGLICGAVICVTALGTAAYVTVSGYPWIGGIFFGTTLITVIGTFVKSRFDHKETEAKNSSPSPQKPKRRR